MSWSWPQFPLPYCRIADLGSVCRCEGKVYSRNFSFHSLKGGIQGAGLCSLSCGPLRTGPTVTWEKKLKCTNKQGAKPEWKVRAHLPTQDSPPFTAAGLRAVVKISEAEESFLFPTTLPSPHLHSAKKCKPWDLVSLLRGFKITAGRSTLFLGFSNCCLGTKINAVR